MTCFVEFPIFPAVKRIVFTIASLESRLTSDTYNIHQMIGMMQRLGIRAPILLLGGITMSMFMEPVLTLVLLAVLPFVAVTVFSISQRGIPMYTQLQQAVDRMVRVVRENSSGIRVIKALSKTEYEKERFKAANKNIVEKETKASVTMAASNPLMNLFLNTGLTLVVVGWSVSCERWKDTARYNFSFFNILYDYFKCHAFD